MAQANALRVISDLIESGQLLDPATEARDDLARGVEKLLTAGAGADAGRWAVIFTRAGGKPGRVEFKLTDLGRVKGTESEAVRRLAKKWRVLSNVFTRRGKFGFTAAFVHRPDDVVLDLGFVPPADQGEFPFAVDEPIATPPAKVRSKVRPAELIDDGALYIRACVNEENDWNEGTELRSSETGRSETPQRAHSHSLHSATRRTFRSPELWAGLIPDDEEGRDALAGRILEVADRVRVDLGDPAGTKGFLYLLAGYLRCMTRGIADRDIANLTFGAANPGTSARTRNSGRLYTGKLKKLIESRTDALKDDPILRHSIHVVGPRNKLGHCIPAIKRLFHALGRPFSEEAESYWFGEPRDSSTRSDGRPQSPRAP